MSLNDGFRAEIQSEFILAAVSGQFDPFQGPQTTLRMVKPGSKCDDEKGLVWLMRYLLGDSTLSEDYGFARMSHTLRVARSELVLQPTSWNWKHISLPELGYAVITVLFTHAESEANVVLALVADSEKHGDKMTSCAPVLASMLLTAMLNRHREVSQDDDGMIDAFELSTINQANDLKDLVFAADQIIAGGISVGVPTHRMQYRPSRAMVSQSSLIDFAVNRELYTPLVQNLLSATSAVIIGENAGEVLRWLHSAAFLLPGYRRQYGVLLPRAGMPVPTLSLQGVLLPKDGEDNPAKPNSKGRVLAAMTRWDVPVLVINSDTLHIELGNQLPNSSSGAPDTSFMRNERRGLMYNLIITLAERSSEILRHAEREREGRERDRGRDVDKERSMKSLEAWLVALRTEIDMLAKRCAHMNPTAQGDLLPALLPNDCSMVRASLVEPADKQAASLHVQGQAYNSGLEFFP